jgi:hypothetical protein
MLHVVVYELRCYFVSFYAAILRRNHAPPPRQSHGRSAVNGYAARAGCGLTGPPASAAFSGWILAVTLNSSPTYSQGTEYVFPTPLILYMTSNRKKGFRVYSDNCLIPPEDTGPGSLFPASEKALLLLYGDGSDSLQYNCIAIFLPHQGSLLSLSNNIAIPTDPSILKSCTQPAQVKFLHRT